MNHWIVAVALAGGCAKAAEPPAPSAAGSGSGSAAKVVDRVEVDVEKAKHTADEAQKLAEQAVADADAAQANVDKLTKELAELDAKTNAAIEAVTKAQNQADRDAAQAKLTALQQEKVGVQTGVGAARGDAAKAARLKGVKISKECLANPLAKGC